jgi:hypothetical protein
MHGHLGQTASILKPYFSLQNDMNQTNNFYAFEQTIGI